MTKKRHAIIFPKKAKQKRNDLTALVKNKPKAFNNGWCKITKFIQTFFNNNKSELPENKD